MRDGNKRLIIRSGGQTAVDRGALDASIKLGFEVRGWRPKGHVAEDARIDEGYPVTETESDKCSIRTDFSARDAYAASIISTEPLEGGTLLAEQCANRCFKPCFIYDINQAKNLDVIVGWLHSGQFAKLNEAGPRESKQPGFYQITFYLIAKLLLALDCVSS